MIDGWQLLKLSANQQASTALALLFERSLALSTAVWAGSAAVRTKGTYYRDKYNRKYNRLCARRGPVRAIMAIADKLLSAAFHMLSTGEAFRDPGKSYLDQVARKRSTAKLV